MAAHPSENASFAGISTSVLRYPNGNALDPVGFEIDTGIPSQGDVGAPLLHGAEAPDLSGLVSKLQKRPVFTGAYSKVYVGRFGTQKVAIKNICVVKSHSVTDRKFRRERFIWWQLRHPNILPLYGYFEDDDGVEVSHALVSEWAEGGSAAEYIQQDLSWEQRMNLLHDVAKGLQYLHGTHPCVVHGDLKPLNVLISKGGVGQLCDFGLARLIHEASDSGMTTTTAHTGTVRYLAHELVELEAVPTKATDMYALGCVALEIIYKIPPHSSLQNSWEISRAIWQRKPPAERPMYPEELFPLWELVKSCWIIDPSERPVAGDVCQYLDQNVPVLSRALKTAHQIHSEQPYGTKTLSPPCTSIPVLPIVMPPKDLFDSLDISQQPNDPPSSSTLNATAIPLARIPSQGAMPMGRPLNSHTPLSIPDGRPISGNAALAQIPAIPGDTALHALESEPYLAERFGVHVPNLSGQVWGLDEGTVFPGTYSTVYPGVYGDQKVAIKVLRMIQKSDNIRRKFRRELFIWWSLRHVNVLPLYGYLEDNESGHGVPSLISKWAEHGSAAQYIHCDLRWDQRANLFYDVAKGLNYLHGFKPLVVHADLKPQNVVVNKDGVGQLCDFGLTRLVKEELDMEEELETGLTTTTTHTGTQRYLAYELVEYEDEPIPTTDTDVYALGCLGLEFIYQVPPHASLRKNYGKIIRAIGDGIPPAKRPANPEEVVPLLWDLVEACWSNVPEDRPKATQVSEYLGKNLEALSESLEQCSWAPEYLTR